MAAQPRTRAKLAIKALRNAQTRAKQHSDAADQLKTLERGIATAVRWLDGKHPQDAVSVEGASKAL